MDPAKGANGWTGGQWSLVRVLSALVLGVYMPGWIAGNCQGTLEVLLLGAIATLTLVLLALGWGMLVVPVMLFGLLASLPAPDVFLSVGSQYASPYDPLGGREWVWLLAYGVWCWALWTPPPPYGSLPARRRLDPGGRWRLPWAWHALASGLFLAYVLAVAVEWAYWTRLGLDIRLPKSEWKTLWMAALAVAFLWSHFHRAARPWLWAAGLLNLEAALWSAPEQVVQAPLRLILALLAFDPGWIRPVRAGTTDTLFYDGGCGLCHASVRFVLAEDRTGSAFRFAPIAGKTWRETFPDDRLAPVQTVVVHTAKGEVLERSTAALYLARRLGGFWRLLGAAGRLVPRRLRDGAYDAIARLRYGIAGSPAEACPVITSELQRRFDLRP